MWKDLALLILGLVMALIGLIAAIDLFLNKI